jgi:protein-S-isoprenylcysteine O-methyltransferase Ste14
MPMPDTSRGPGIPFPPPLVYVAAYGIAALLNMRLEFLIDGRGAGTTQSVIGSALIGAGLLWMAYGIVTFLRARTSVIPDQPARQLVTWGPYGVSRNPMYLGITAAYLGIAVVNNHAWPLVLLPLALMGLTVIIRREERYLRAAFGDAYDQYCRRVRRWV